MSQDELLRAELEDLIANLAPGGVVYIPSASFGTRRSLPNFAEVLHWLWEVLFARDWRYIRHGQS